MKIQIEVARPHWLRLPRTWRMRALLTLVLAGAVAVPVAWANHDFGDVPNGNPHHADISTIKRAGVTLGCNPPANTLYCPDQFVRRDQMGSFVARALRVQTPAVLKVNTGGGAVDPDLSPVVCQTPSRTPTVAALAQVHSTVALQAAGAMGWQMEIVFSTNNGATWGSIDSWFMRGGSSVSGEWGSAVDVITLNLSAGTSYRFGARVHRDTGTADATANRCKVVAMLNYHDAGASSLSDSASATGAGDGDRAMK